jgi:hypothetical protein
MDEPDREDLAGHEPPPGATEHVADPAAPAAPAATGDPAARPRPVIERVGLAGVALLLAILFGVMAVAAFQGGELFLAVMSGIGCLMVVWVGGLTLVRGR